MASLKEIDERCAAVDLSAIRNRIPQGTPILLADFFQASLPSGERLREHFLDEYIQTPNVAQIALKGGGYLDIDLPDGYVAIEVPAGVLLNLGSFDGHLFEPGKTVGLVVKQENMDKISEIIRSYNALRQSMAELL